MASKKNTFTNAFGYLFVAVLAVAVVFFLVFSAVKQSTVQPLPTQPDFRVQEFTGTWYATHEFPTSFTSQCSCTQAMYQLTSDDTLTVRNSCSLPDGRESIILGEATPVDPSDLTRLEVSFAGIIPRKGDFYVIAFSQEAGWAVVGSPDRANLWFLSRDRVLSGDDYRVLLEYSSQLGFDVSRLVPVSQVDCQ